MLADEILEMLCVSGKIGHKKEWYSKKFVTSKHSVQLTVHWIEITTLFERTVYYAYKLFLNVLRFSIENFYLQICKGGGGVTERSGRDIYRVFNLKRDETSGY